VGAVIVVDRSVIATGYNGSPSGHRNCCDYGSCLRDEQKIESGTQLSVCYAVHAELNAIAQAARHGHATQGATMYVTMQPCAECAKAIIGAGIKLIVYARKYPNTTSSEMFTLAGIGSLLHQKEEN
jgi:dCMP deaminase